MGIFKRQRRITGAFRKHSVPGGNWTKVGRRLTFRAEVMPGRDATERTFTVKRVLGNGRVEFIGLDGEHSRTEFQPA